ncbi:MAG: hypothetical protein ACOYVD_05385 [Bacillota bacterium]
MQRGISTLIFICCIFLFTGCSLGGNPEVKEGFVSAMDAYQDIWKSKNLTSAKSLADKAFSNEEIKQQVIAGYKANREIDQGLDITDRKYNVSVIKYDDNEASLKVRAYLKGYPISLTSGQKLLEKKQDFSFGPHEFVIKKEQGIWKISSF